ncbi:MAG: galactokinase [Paludibacteraceae bacterium]|nr:galactokinase [Paludibacteraceae bacterium]
MELQELKRAFAKVFGQQATAVYFAPGRVNLIGEHTDYNGGFVFPCALSFGTYLLVAENNTATMRFQSLNIDGDMVTVGLDALMNPLPNNCWVNYPLGCIAQYIKRGMNISKGYDMLFWGNVPAGAGLSSSAAIEVVTAAVFNDICKAGYDKTELAKIGQLSEHEFAGVNCGIMDQFASAQGKKDHAIFLNCDTLDFQLVPVKLNGVKVVISNTHSPHKLDSGAYNARVAQCQLAVKQLQTVRPELKNLAQLTEAEFKQVESAITDETAHRRARHVVGEVQRTTDAVEALKKGDLTTFGQLMNQSHVSLRDDYEVTGPELDAMAEAAWKIDGVIGSRMTGGGFGGCTVSLVKDEAIPTFIEQVGKEYTAKTGLQAEFYVAEIGDGVRQVND